MRQDPRKLTEAQKRVYDAIVAFTAERGYSPSIRELCAITGLSSSSTVHCHITAIQKKGVLHRGKSLPRSIVVHAPPGCCCYCGERAGATKAASTWKGAAKALRERAAPRRTHTPPPVAAYLV